MEKAARTHTIEIYLARQAQQPLTVVRTLKLHVWTYTCFYVELKMEVSQRMRYDFKQISVNRWQI